MNDVEKKVRFILDLHTVGAIKFGQFKLSSGTISPYYLDLRSLAYYPYLLNLTADVFWDILKVLNFDIIVGVPYTGIPIAVAISLKHNQSMVFVRKERKQHGTERLVEGDFHPGQRAVIVDDVVTNGESKLAVIRQFEQEGLEVKDIVYLLDRGQGGSDILKEKGYRCHNIFTIDEIFEILFSYKKVPREVIDGCLAFTKEAREQLLKSN